MGFPKKFIQTLMYLMIMYSSSANAVYNVQKLGAKRDGRTDSSKAFQDAWTRACGSFKPSLIYVPPGRYLVTNLLFSGQCNNTDITIRIDGTLVAPSDYLLLHNRNIDTWISFQSVTGVSIQGGILDGQGSSLWACKLSGSSKCSGVHGVTSLMFTNSKNILIHGLISRNSQLYHLVINSCDNVDIKGVQISASKNSPNTDGIHVQLSTGVTIMASGIKTGDDCISIGAGTRNLWIQNVACGPGHGISIGSLAKDLDEPGVQNVTVKAVVFTGTQNGVRIKAWPRQSKGFVNGVLFQNVVMRNVQNPIVIDQHYCPNNEVCPDEESGIKINGVTYKDIQGTSATQVAVRFDCSNTNPCQGIRLENVKLKYQNQPARSSCVRAVGSAHGLVVPAGCL